MSAHVLLNLLSKLRKIDKMRGLSTFYFFFATSLINVRFNLSYDIKIILKTYFWRENVRVLPYA